MVAGPIQSRTRERESVDPIGHPLLLVLSHPMSSLIAIATTATANTTRTTPSPRVI